MIDIKFLRENPDVVKQNIKNKFQDHKLPMVDEVIELDAKARAAQQEADELRSQKNKIAKQIGALMAQGKKEEAEEVKAQVADISKRLAELGNVAHDTFHAAARLRALFVVHEMDDCDFATPPSCISRRDVLILENSCTAESRLANWTFPMFASTASWLRLLPMAFCCRKTSFSPSRMMIFLPRQQLIT